MKHALFITGTGTDVGKTYVTALIAKQLREAGERPGYYKAALSGAERVHGVRTAGDAAYVAKAAGLQAEQGSMVSYVYDHPVSPHLAARLEGPAIQLEKIREDFSRALERCDYLLMEGSGGIVCPLRLEETALMLTDVIQALGLPVLIVGDARLGGINAAVLTVEYARSRGIAVAGIILNFFCPGDIMHEDNLTSIERLTGVPVLATAAQGAQDLSIRTKPPRLCFQEVKP